MTNFLEAPKSLRNANGFHDFTQCSFGRFRLPLQRSVTRAGDNAMRKNCDRQVLEIVGNAVVTAVKKCAGLCGALQHERSAWTDAERELVRFSRAIDDFERVILQTRIHFDVSDSFLHCENLV